MVQLAGILTLPHLAWLHEYTFLSAAVSLASATGKSSVIWVNRLKTFNRLNDIFDFGTSTKVRISRVTQRGSLGWLFFSVLPV
jgi:hypothetical protein